MSINYKDRIKTKLSKNGAYGAIYEDIMTKPSTYFEELRKDDTVKMFFDFDRVGTALTNDQKRELCLENARLMKDVFENDNIQTAGKLKDPFVFTVEDGSRDSTSGFKNSLHQKFPHLSSTWNKDHKHLFLKCKERAEKNSSRYPLVTSNGKYVFDHNVYHATQLFRMLGCYKKAEEKTVPLTLLDSKTPITEKEFRQSLLTCSDPSEPCLLFKVPPKRRGKVYDEKDKKSAIEALHTIDANGSYNKWSKAAFQFKTVFRDDVERGEKEYLAWCRTGDVKFTTDEDVHSRWVSTDVYGNRTTDPIQALRALGADKRSHKKKKIGVTEAEIAVIMTDVVRERVRLTNPKADEGRVWDEKKCLWIKSHRDHIISACADMTAQYVAAQIKERKDGKSVEKNEEIDKFTEIISSLRSWTPSHHIFRFASKNLVDTTLEEKINIDSPWELPLPDGKILDIRSLETRQRTQEDLYDCECNASFGRKQQFEIERAELLQVLERHLPCGHAEHDRVEKHLEEMELGEMKDFKNPDLPALIRLLELPFEYGKEGTKDPDVIRRVEVEAAFANLYKRNFPQSWKYADTLMGEPSKSNYFARLMGYSMTACTEDRHTYIHFGQGQGGKTSYKNVMQKILGEMYVEAEQSVLFGAPKSSENAHSSHMVACKGKRFVSVSEPLRTDRYDAHKLRIAGGHRESKGVRQINTASSSMMVHGKFHSNTNFYNFWEMDDCAASDRVWVLTYLSRFADSYSQVRKVGKTMRKFGEVRVMEADGDFTDKFYTPGEALNELFTMLVYAAHEVWMFQPMFKKKLPVPYVVQKDTLQYTFQNDTMGKFTSEYLSQPQDTTTTPLSLIYSAYKNWAQLRGCKPKGQDSFEGSLSAKGYVVEDGEVDCTLVKKDGFYPPVQSSNFSNKRKRDDADPDNE